MSRSPINMFPHAALTQPIRVNMEDQDAAPMPLYMFWEPFLGSRLDIWDVWTLQVAIVTALIFQGILTLGLICGLIYLRREFVWMRSDLRQERQTYLTTDRCRHIGRPQDLCNPADGRQPQTPC